MAEIVLRRVGRDTDIEAFLDAAVAAQGGNPNWIAPLRLQFRRMLDPARSPFLQENATAAFVAFAAGRPVGRIFVARNEAHLRRYNDGTGHFGFLEAIDAAPVFDRLIAAAAEWMQQQGLTRMVGPLSPSMNYEVGVQVDGFETPSMVGINYAPPCYAAHLERLGFAPVMDVYAVLWDIEDYRRTWQPLSLAPGGRIRALVERWEGRHELALRTLRQRHYYRDMQLVTDIYNDAWQDNWGAIPIGAKEARFLAALMRPTIRSDWVTFAYWRGEPIAIFVQIPNLNEAIADLDGRLLPFGWAKLMWRLHRAGVTSSRIAMAGVRRAHVATRPGRMAALLLLADAVEKAHASGVQRVEASWILANNSRMLNLVGTIMGRRYKTFRLFGRACRP